MEVTLNVNARFNRLPPEIFKLQTITKLEVGKKIRVRSVPENAYVPMLQTLILNIVKFGAPPRQTCALNALKFFLSSCPMLDSFAIDDFKWDLCKWDREI